MGLFTVLLIYLLFCAALLFVVLFGQQPAFAGTPVGATHRLLCTHVPHALRRAVRCACGADCEARLEAAEDCCCYSRNPAVQILFVLLLFGGYYLYCREIFAFLPQPYVPAWHQHTAAVSIGLVLAAFWAASASDPGYIDVQNQADFAALYPHPPSKGKNGCSQKDCRSCKRSRLARSKHCPLCDRCIARWDHHCSWVNNCIGLLNLRHFLAFLSSIALVCAYGLVLGCLVLRGALQQSGVLDTPFLDHRTGAVILLSERSWANRLRLAQLLGSRFSLQVVLLFFLGLAGACVAAFLGFHLRLVSKNVTTYESIKAGRARQAAAAARLVEAGTRPSAGRACLDVATCGCLSSLGGSEQRNVWDRGWAQNFAEVLAPRQTMRARVKRV